LDDLSWLCGLGLLPVVVKGVLRADDAIACIDAGAAGLVVSNHGGNQLEDAIATSAALPAIADACGKRAEIYVDGGIRSGPSIIKALALGARAVMVGRPFSHGLAVGGAEGANKVLALLKADLSRAMALCGTATLSDITPDLIAH
jgi:4-hydroxymandelate oxidase